jgi:serine/threonine protein kinase
MIGRTIAHFRVIAKLGEGGMGEVYLAEDTKLGRNVAIKVIPARCATHPDRLERFEREARLLASLKHPNIAAIYGIEETEEARLLILEFVEGVDLSQRLARGALPPKEAMSIALQVAEALEAAHEQGIVHRDLKPANIMLEGGTSSPSATGREATVKVLDFGLAKSLTEPLGSEDLTQSPTLAEGGGTRAGTILGTVGYMSPEQARGEPADRRADIWAWGCVLYEMVTGSAPFGRGSLAESLAAVLESDPDWTLLPDNSPWRLRDLLRRCLEEERRQRLQHIGDARILLHEALSDASREPTVASLSAAPRPGRGRLMIGAALLLISGIAVGALVTRLGRPQTEAPSMRHLSIVTDPLAVTHASLAASSIAISPDGRRLVYRVDEPPMLHQRLLDRAEATVIPGTEGAIGPFFSPDGEWVGFWTGGGELKKVPLGGGPAERICATQGFWGGSWGDDGYVYFSDFSGGRYGLSRVPAAGGTPETVVVGGTAPDGVVSEGFDVAWPQVLPRGAGVLYAASGPDRDMRGGSAHLEVASPAGERKRVLEGASMGRYLPSGHLLFMTPKGSFSAVGFRLEGLEVQGQPTPSLDGVMVYGNNQAHLAVGRDGTVAYVPRPSEEGEDELQWLDRQGAVETILADRRDLRRLSLSPEGDRVAVEIRTEERQNKLWMQDLRRGTLSPIIGDRVAAWPLWSPDGSVIAFTQIRRSIDGVEPGLFTVDVTGDPTERRLTTAPFHFPGSFSPDGRLFVYSQFSNETALDIFSLSLEGRAPPKPFLQTEHSEQVGRVSPDGRWLAYVSDESGRYEIYVRSFPDPGGSFQVSINGGWWPRWNPTGGELFFLEGSRLMAVEVEGGATFSAGIPKLLFDAEGMSWFDVHPDGERFVIVRDGEEIPATVVSLLLDWIPGSE